MRTDCAVCTQPLVARVIHTEESFTGPQPTMWKNMAAIEATHLPENEFVDRLWCPNCELLYNHDTVG